MLGPNQCSSITDIIISGLRRCCYICGWKRFFTQGSGWWPLCAGLCQGQVRVGRPVPPVWPHLCYLCGCWPRQLYQLWHRSGLKDWITARSKTNPFTYRAAFFSLTYCTVTIKGQRSYRLTDSTLDHFETCFTKCLVKWKIYSSITNKAHEHFPFLSWLRLDFNTILFKMAIAVHSHSRKCRNID